MNQGLRILIPQYAGTTGNKAAISRSSRKTGTASGDILVESVAQFWRSGAAITQVTLLPIDGNFVAGSRATLYGLSGG